MSKINDTINSREFGTCLLLVIILFVMGLISNHYWLLIVGLILFYATMTQSPTCFRLMKIEYILNLKYFYLSRLPEYNPSSVFIFNASGQIIYVNNTAKKTFKHILNLDNFNINASHFSLKKENEWQQLYHSNDKTYQLSIIHEVQTKMIYVYASDVTMTFHLQEEIESTQRDIIYRMGEIGESRSKETGNHVKRVAEYSKLLALLIGLSDEEAELLKMVSPMHDIGKVGIPDNILHKPGKLTDEEFEIMKTHASIGYEMLNSGKTILKTAAIVAHEHHEKFDGSGYPRGLIGDKIHIFGRITAVADVFDALGSDRVYKRAWSIEEILSYFEQNSGTHFDPELIQLFFQNLERFIEIRNTYKDNNLHLKVMD